MKIIIVIATLLLVCGCMEETGTDDTSRKAGTTPPEKDYNITSSIPFDSSACSSTSFSHLPGGFNAGIRVSLTSSGQQIQGRGRLYHQSGHGTLTTGEHYKCLNGINTSRVYVQVASEGHAAIFTGIDLIPGNLTSIEIPLEKSCAGGPSCMENYRKQLEYEGAGEDLDEKLSEFESRIKIVINRTYGWEPGEYALSCIECDMDRGGYVKGTGTYMNATPFEFYYRWGWCSSGGGDCGWTTCLTSRDTVYEEAKTRVCGKIKDYEHVEKTVNSTYTMQTLYDKTNQTIQKCRQGKYEYANPDTKTISIIQQTNRYKATPKKGDTNCLAN